MAVAVAAAGAAAAHRAARSRRPPASSGLRYFRYHSDFPHPVPASTAYVRRRPGQGWPEQCPPIQAAQSFGWDVVNPFDIRFVHAEDGWEVASAVEVEGGDLEERAGVTPFSQDNCWQWDPDQVLPHRISPHVFPEIRHQAKVSTYLYLQTPPGWVLLMGDVPNLRRRFWTLSALLETDWYFPAHPWHCVIELPVGRDTRPGDELVIPRGEPLCRLTPVRRGAYAASEMSGEEFAALFNGGQRWLEEHGRPSEDPDAEGALDITRAYALQQRTSSFAVKATMKDGSRQSQRERRL